MTRLTIVSLRFSSLGLTQAIISAKALPPSESWSNRVSFESRYGTWLAFLLGSPRAEMTLPNA